MREYFGHQKFRLWPSVRSQCNVGRNRGAGKHLSQDITQIYDSESPMQIPHQRDTFSVVGVEFKNLASKSGSVIGVALVDIVPFDP